MCLFFLKTFDVKPTNFLSTITHHDLTLPSVSKDFVLMVLLCACLVLGPLQPKQEWDFLEFFAGDGRISRLAAKTGACVASYEILHGNVPQKNQRRGRSSQQRNSMDFNGESGFAFFGMLLSNKLFMLFVFASHDPSFKNRVPVMVGWWEWLVVILSCIHNQLF